VVHGELVSSAPRFAPSSLNWTPTTPTLSDAFAVTEITPETVAPASGELTETVGGLLSHATVAAESVAWVDLLPAPSTASTARLYVCPQVRPVNVYESEAMFVTSAPLR